MSEVEYGSLLEKEHAHILLMVHTGRSSKSACIWKNYDQNLDELLYRVEKFELSQGIASSFLPFDTLLYPVPWKMRRSIAELYAKQFEFHPHKYLFDKQFIHLHENRTRLHIAYLSYDYTDHPTAHLMEGLFVHHDKSKYEISAIGYGRNDGSAYRKRIEKVAERFVNMAEFSTDESADLIFENKVHILVDAQGHTRGKYR
jgi:protein O-GlcNAc transferase